MLASTAQAVQETCGDAAEYFDPHDDQALAQWMRQAAEDAVLNADYVLRSLEDVLDAPFAASGPCMHEALFSDSGLPEGFSTLDIAKALLRYKGIRLNVVTGGPGVVKEAMDSGKKSICAGPGNPPSVVDETADLDAAARAAVASAFGFGGQKCSACSRLVAVDAIYDDLVARVRRGEHLRDVDAGTTQFGMRDERDLRLDARRDETVERDLAAIGERAAVHPRVQVFH